MTPMESKQIIVICLSGKRYNGKGEVARILKNLYESVGKTVTITCFSYGLKKAFCEINGLDLERFLSDHEYKNSFRDELTAYLDKTDPRVFTQLTIDFVNHALTDVYIIDDLRCLDYQVLYLNKQKGIGLLNHWTMMMLRINASDKERQKRGWIKTVYDEHYCETELDKFDGFDYVIGNNGTKEELEIKIKDWFRSITL
jgi:phosphomevalonate kinase